MADAPVTQKKTLKLKSTRPKPEAKPLVDGEATEEEQGGAASVQAAMPLSHGHVGLRQRSYTFDAMLALTIFLLLAALLLFQWLEYSFYDQPPLAFPFKLPGMSAGGM